MIIPTRAFYRTMALCSTTAAVGMLVAQSWLARYPSPEDVADFIALHANPVFIAQSWVILVQVFLMFLAHWGVAVKNYRLSPALFATGFLFFLIWELLELVPRSINLFAASYVWAPQYLAAVDESTRSIWEIGFRMFDDVSGAIRETRRVVIILAYLLFGLAIWRIGGWVRAISALYLLNSLRLTLGVIGGWSGSTWVSGGGTAAFLLLMVPMFILIGVWLWREPEPV